MEPNSHNRSLATSRSSPASRTCSNRPAKPSRSTTIRPRPRSTAASSSRSRRRPRLAGRAGCRRPDLQILPFSAIPDDQIGHIAPGQPTFYATSIPRPGGALPVLVESHDGRPTKIEGNPQHPASLGSHRRVRPGLDPRSLQSRSRDVGQVPRRDGEGRAAALGRLRSLRAHACRQVREEPGRGASPSSTEQVPSPSAAAHSRAHQDRAAEGVVAHLRAGRSRRKR